MAGRGKIILNGVDYSGSIFEPNPTIPSGATVTPVTNMKVDDDYYNLIGSGGTSVEGNPTIPSGVTPTALTGLKIDNDYYSISGGGGGGNVNLQKTVLLNTPITTPGTYTLTDDYTNYDIISIQAGNGSSEVDIHTYITDEITEAMTNNLTITNPNTGGWFNFTMVANEIIIQGMQLSAINIVVGYKFNVV